MSPEPSSAVALTASELSKEAMSLLGRVFGPAADEVGEHLRLKVRGFLERNRNATLNRAATMIAEAGGVVREIPLRLSLPIIEGASLEEEPTLRERWAALLANASSARTGETIPPVFADILGNLSVEAARCLDLLGGTFPRRGESYGFMPQAELQEEGGYSPDQLTMRYLGVEDWDDVDAFTAERENVMALADLLVREGLVSIVPVYRHKGPPTIASIAESPIAQDGLDIRITHLGRQFVEACSPPAPRQASAR